MSFSNASVESAVFEENTFEKHSYASSRSTTPIDTNFSKEAQTSPTKKKPKDAGILTTYANQGFSLLKFDRKNQKLKKAFALPHLEDLNECHVLFWPNLAFFKTVGANWTILPVATGWSDSTETANRFYCDNVGKACDGYSAIDYISHFLSTWNLNCDKK